MKKVFYLILFKWFFQVQKRIGDYRIFGKEEDQGTNFPGPMPLFRSFLRPFPAGPKSTSADEKLKVQKEELIMLIIWSVIW